MANLITDLPTIHDVKMMIKEVDRIWDEYGRTIMNDVPLNQPESVRVDKVVPSLSLHNEFTGDFKLFEVRRISKNLTELTVETGWNDYIARWQKELNAEYKHKGICFRLIRNGGSTSAVTNEEEEAQGHIRSRPTEGLPYPVTRKNTNRNDLLSSKSSSDKINYFANLKSFIRRKQNNIIPSANE